jgi:hypothetical protein
MSKTDSYVDWELILSLLLEEATGENVSSKIAKFDKKHVAGIKRVFAKELEAVMELRKESLRMFETSEFSRYSLDPLRKLQEQIEEEREAIKILSRKEEMKIHVAKVSDINPELLFDIEETDMKEEIQNYNARRMVYEANVERLTKTEQELGEGKWISYEATLSNVEECMNCPSKIQKYSLDFVSSKWFDKFILFVIILNCITLALDNPQDRGSELSSFIKLADYVFIVIFVVEMVLKITAYGFVKEENSYLSDAWNVMDFVIVMTGLFSILLEILEAPSSNVSAFRAFRVLRPLRTITQFPGLRVLVNAVLESLTLLGNTVVIMGFFFLVFGIAALSLFKGVLKYRCFTIINGTYTIDPLDIDPARFCSDTARQCREGYECLKLGKNPHAGVVSFDDIGLSIMNLFVFVTLEGWSDAMYYLADTSGHVLSILFFLPVIGLGSFILINLTLAVILSSFRQSKERQYKVIESKIKLHKRRTELQQVRRSLLKMSSNNDDFDAEQKNPTSKWNSVRIKIKTAQALGQKQEKKKPVRQSKIKLLKACMSNAWTGMVNWHKRKREQITGHKYYDYFNTFIIICIVINSIAFACDYHGMPDDYRLVLETVNLVFTIVFIFELLVMMIIHNPYNYVSDYSRCFDGFLVLTSVVNLVVDNMEVSANAGAKSLLEALVVFRVARALRIFRVARQLKSMATVLDVMSRSVSSFSYIFLLLLLFMFIFTILGMQLFSQYKLQNRNQCDDFGLCFITVFQVLTGENWNSLLEDFAEAGASLGGVFLYFLMWIFAGQYILLNLILAVIMEQFGNMEEEQAKEAKSSPGGVRKALSRLTSSFGFVSSPLGKGNGEGKGFKSKRLFCLDPKGIIVKKAKELATNKRFEHFIMLLIAISSIVLAAEGPQDEEPTPFMAGLDVFFNIVFIFEAAIKIVAMGFITPKNSYLRDSWNVLDFIIVLAGSLTMAMESMPQNTMGGDISFMKVLRMLRVLRPLKAISRNRGMQLVVRCLIASLSSIGNVLIVAFVLFFAFAVAGYALFGGKFYSCTDPNFPPKTSRFGVMNASNVDQTATINGTSTIIPADPQYKWLVEPCGPGFFADDGSEREWKNAEFNFDNFYMSIITLFVMFSLEGWPDILWPAMDVTAVDVSPSPGAFALLGFLYFIFFIFLASMLLLNLFTGVIFESYLKQKRMMDTEGISMFITPEQQEWIDKCKIYMQTRKPTRKFDPPEHPLRLKMYNIVTKNQFENLIFSFIILNLIQQACTWDTEPPEYTAINVGISYMFTLIFFLEACMKIYGLEWKPYWSDQWNKFDFLLVLFSGVDFAISMISLNFSFFRVLRVGRVLGRLLRIIRVSRVARLAKAFSGLRTIGATLGMSLYSLINIATLLFLLYFIYAVLGVKSFGTIKEGNYINGQRNFNNFGNAFTYTIVISTGESWNGVMHDAIEHGDFLAVLYFFTFIIFAQLVMMNLFIMIIVENFDNLNSKNDNGELEFDAMFKAIWELFDSDGTGKMNMLDLEDFLKRLPNHYGLRRDASNSKFLKILRQLNLHVWLEPHPELEGEVMKMIDFKELLVALHRRMRHTDIDDSVLETLNITPLHVKDSIICGATSNSIFGGKKKKEKTPQTGMGTVADEFAVRSIARIFKRWRRYNGNERSRSPVPEIDGIKSPTKKILIINNSLIQEHNLVGELSAQITQIEGRLGSSSPGRRTSLGRSRSGSGNYK